MMSKIFICADIEGTTNIQNPLEIRKTEPLHYGYFAKQMTREIAAACCGAKEAGVGRILIKDSHSGGDNILPEELPEDTELIRGWGLHPYHMMFGIEPDFDGVFLTGCHSAGGTDTSPLSHTNNSKNNWVKINGEIVGEAYINSLTAAYIGVPTILITGDEGICQFMKRKIPKAEIVATTTYKGNASRSRHPHAVIEEIREAAKRAMVIPKELCFPKMPDVFQVEICFSNHLRARGASFYPGAVQIESHQVAFRHRDWYEVLRFFFFVLSDNLV